jgi:selenocysteine lyase/cysteine desulfurase
LSDYREQFPVTKNLIYLNHAAVAPLSRRAAEAMQNLAQDALDFGSLHYDKWMATYEGVRASCAKLIHSNPSEIAIVKNTSEGIATVAMGIAWKPGDIVVAFEEEFPANMYPWVRLEARGVEVRWLRFRSDRCGLQRCADAGDQLCAVSERVSGGPPEAWRDLFTARLLFLCGRDSGHGGISD